MIEENEAELDKLFKDLKQKKEEKFKISKSLKENIAKIKELRSNYRNLVEQAKLNKAEREKLKESIKELAAKLKEIKKEKEKIGNVESPSALKSRINKIEWKIQTEVIPYEKEKELVKIRKELEKKLELALKANAVKKDETTIRAELASKIFEEQMKHENLVKLSKNCEELRNQIKSISAKIEEDKLKLKQLSGELVNIKKRISELKPEKIKSTGIQIKMSKEDLEKKLKEIKEKFSKNKKLTTEDLLILQASKEGEDIILS